MSLNIRNIIYITLVVITVRYLLDAGVEASKNRKTRHRHRSKRTHGDRPHRHAKPRKSVISEKVTKTSNGKPSLIVVEKQKNLKPNLLTQKNHHDFGLEKVHAPADFETKSHSPKIEGGLEEHSFPSHVYDQILNGRRENSGNQQQHVDTTILPVIEANLAFYIKRKQSENFYLPPTTTTATINGFSSTELGLLPFHKTNGKYGLHTYADTVFGKVVLISDAGRRNSHFACGEAIANILDIPKDNEPWIALMERGHCSFFRKIKLAEKNNASAVIIYDNKVGEVPRINTIGTRIVSVIMRKHDGHHVAKIVEGHATVMAHITVKNDPTPDPSKTYSTSMLSNLQMAGASTPHGGAMTRCRTSIRTTILSTLIVVFYYRSVMS